MSFQPLDYLHLVVGALSFQRLQCFEVERDRICQDVRALDSDSFSHVEIYACDVGNEPLNFLSL